jgi:SAM-dependent methyltransferase
MDPVSIREFAASFQKSRILLTAVELDIFTSIDENGNTHKETAGKLHLDERACERLMNALAALGFLRKKAHLFFNTDDSSTYLSRKSSRYSEGLMHLNNLWDTWSNLSGVVRNGTPAGPRGSDEEGGSWLSHFIAAMHYRAKLQAPVHLKNIDLSGIRTILDVGGGSRAYSMEFVRNKPDIEAVILDLPDVVPITESYIRKEGFEGKLKTLAGDYTSDDFPTGFDMVLLSAVIHSNSLAMNQSLVKKCYGSLNPGGRIIILDWIMNEDRTEPPAGAVFAVNMLVATEAGDCFTGEEVRGMLISAGFKNISRTLFDSGLSQVTAWRMK